MPNTENFCRLSIAATGAFLHPLGDQTPIDCRYGELIRTVDLPSRQLKVVDQVLAVDYGSLKNPRAVIVWNVSGQGLQSQPTPEEAAAIAAKVLLVGITGPDGATPTGWQDLRPAKIGEHQGGSTILWLAPGARVVLRPAGTLAVTARVLVVPGE